jgi:hypothetical protein
MSSTLSRREFLKLSAAAAGGFALRPFEWNSGGAFSLYPIGWGRVASAAVDVYAKPGFDNETISKLRRDELLAIFEEIIDPASPKHNRRWYRIDRGFIYSARIQRVEPRTENPVEEHFPEHGSVAEVTVPLTSTFRLTHTADWQPLYRLYYSSVHFVKGVLEGPDARPWYRIHDHRLNIEYCAPAHHLRIIPYKEYSPISEHIDPEDKRIEITISTQTLLAYEGDREVFRTQISSGVHTDEDHLAPGDLPTDTPIGSFRMSVKTPSRHMGNGFLTDDYTTYELPGVPWTCFFHETGVGTHGTYWHDNFGQRMSHGCVNMRTAEALWIFRWITPVFNGEKLNRSQRGTRVDVKP